jgi:hypothetical protein
MTITGGTRANADVEAAASSEGKPSDGAPAAAEVEVE